VRSISKAPNGGAWAVPNSPLGRFGTTDDVAALVSYLVSDGAGFVTGAFSYRDDVLLGLILCYRSDSEYLAIPL
jgi:NAD(P)-dependent dehydrogenase (short-subunit alcohol dehydrogenase family)